MESTPQLQVLTRPWLALLALQNTLSSTWLSIVKTQLKGRFMWPEGQLLRSDNAIAEESIQIISLCFPVRSVPNAAGRVKRYRSGDVTGSNRSFATSMDPELSSCINDVTSSASLQEASRSLAAEQQTMMPMQNLLAQSPYASLETSSTFLAPHAADMQCDWVGSNSCTVRQIQKDFLCILIAMSTSSPFCSCS